MIDKIEIIPDRAFLKNEVCGTNYICTGFTRKIKSKGKGDTQYMVFQIMLQDYPVLTAVAKKNEEDRWFVSKIAFCFSSVLYGHNCRMVVTDKDLCLALTIVRLYMSRIVEEGSVQRIVPGTSAGSATYIHHLELMAQFADPGKRFLKASHFAELPYQQKPSIIQYGLFTKIPGKERELRIYDKRSRYPDGVSSCPDVDVTRVELKLKTPGRLAVELFGRRSESGDDEPAVKTIAWLDCYHALRGAMCSLSGFAESIDVSAMSKLKSKPARTLAMGLGDKIDDPIEVSRALSEYKNLVKPCDRTFRDAKRDLRRYAAIKQLPSVMDALPEDFSDFRPEDVIREQVEREYESILMAFNCPKVPDADIEKAWSETTSVDDRKANAQRLRQQLPGIQPSFGSYL